MSEEHQPLALLLDDNLMSTMRIEPQLRKMNYRVQTGRAVPETESDSAATQPALVLINLGSRNLNGVSLVQTCRERFLQARIIGFCGHLEVEIRRAAKAAGIDKILTNDQALSNLQQFI
ncbi:MAG: hypothetical protein JO316_03555 [Abitibacteriaceae bacterium]|nr:hypothetical protein [Abditibacteriaceae bacterium]